MFEDHILLLNMAAAWGVMIMVVAFALAIRKLKITERKLKDCDERLSYSYSELSSIKSKIKSQRKSYYKNGFIVGFREGVKEASRNDKNAVEHELSSEDVEIDRL